MTPARRQWKKFWLFGTPENRLRFLPNVGVANVSGVYRWATKGIAKRFNTNPSMAKERRLSLT